MLRDWELVSCSFLPSGTFYFLELSFGHHCTPLPGWIHVDWTCNMPNCRNKFHCPCSSPRDKYLSASTFIYPAVCCLSNVIPLLQVKYSYDDQELNQCSGSLWEDVCFCNFFASHLLHIMFKSHELLMGERVYTFFPCGALSSHRHMLNWDRSKKGDPSGLISWLWEESSPVVLDGK